MDEHLRDYRSFLVKAKQESTKQFDSAVLTLSSGALGISFSFLDKLVGSSAIKSPRYLYFAWCLWGFSLCLSLISLYTSIGSIEKAITQIDNGEIDSNKSGSRLSRLTDKLTMFSGVCFIIGVVLISCFVAFNHPSQVDLSHPQIQIMSNQSSSPKPNNPSESNERGYTPSPPPPPPPPPQKSESR
jgi:hypothetical protein